MSLPVILTKAVPDIMVRGFDWSKVLTKIGGNVTITQSEWSSNGGITIADGGISGVYTRVTISGGSNAMTYSIYNKITLSDSQVYERSFEVNVATHVYV